MYRRLWLGEHRGERDSVQDGLPPSLFMRGERDLEKKNPHRSCTSDIPPPSLLSPFLLVLLCCSDLFICYIKDSPGDERPCVGAGVRTCVCQRALTVAFTVVWVDESVIVCACWCVCVCVCETINCKHRPEPVMRQGGRDSAATNANNLLLNEIQKPTHTHTLTHSHTLLIFRKKSRCPQTLQQASEATITGLLLISASISFMRKRSSCLPSSADTSQLARVILTSAFISSGPSSIPAPWVETCSCPPGFVGQFCERCAPGFTWDDPGRGPLSACVPCNCHQHGSCHPETGNEQNFYRAFGVCAEFK